MGKSFKILQGYWSNYLRTDIFLVFFWGHRLSIGEILVDLPYLLYQHSSNDFDH